MAKQTITRPFSFDEETDRKLKELSAKFDRSQSHIVRAAVAVLYDDQSKLQQPKPATTEATK